MARKEVDLAPAEASELARMDPREFTLTFIRGLLARPEGGEPKCLPGDRLKLLKGDMGVPDAVQTTVGRVIFNKVVLEWDPAIYALTGYVNRPMDAGAIEDLRNGLGSQMLEGRLATASMIDFVDRLEWAGFAISHFIIPTLGVECVDELPAVVKRKRELIKANAEALANNDIFAAGKIEKELLALAEEELKDAPSMRLFKSGARGNISNNYKNMAVMRGSVRRNASGKFEVSTANLVEGIPKEEYPMYGDLTVSASYGRAVGTREGGYEAKKLSGAFQTVSLGEPGSDCHTKALLTVVVPPSGKDKLSYRWMAADKNGKLKMITPSEAKALVGKTIKIRSPMYCTADKICSKCAGELYYMLDLPHIGLLTSRVGTSVLNQSLKAFHNSTVNTTRIDISKYVF
jgi:hypothetical protein